MPSLCFDEHRPRTKETPSHCQQVLTFESGISDISTKVTSIVVAQQPYNCLSNLSHLSSTPSVPIQNSPCFSTSMGQSLPSSISLRSIEYEPHSLPSLKKEESVQHRHDSVPPPSSFSKPDLDNFSKVPDVLRCRSDRCSASYTGAYRKSNLARHMRLKHKDAVAMRYACAELKCNRGFKRQDARLQHYRKQHVHLIKKAPRLNPNRGCRSDEKSGGATPALLGRWQASAFEGYSRSR
jgi:hypothetical protein